MVIVRCWASAKIGFGHLVRCRVLAGILIGLGHKVIMVGPSSKYITNEDKVLFHQWIEREDWLSSYDEANFLIQLATRYDSKHIIIDDYRSDYEHQLALRDAGLICLQQYDASKPQRFAAQIIVNGSPYEKREFYEKGLYSNDIQMLLGPEYSILRPEFLDTKISKIKKTNTILITFGGGDDKGAMLCTLNDLRGNMPQDWDIRLVMGAHNPQIDSVKLWLKKYPLEKIELLINPPKITEVIASCKIAILSGGTTTFETALLGIPAILIPTAANQYDQGKGWANLGSMLYLGPFENLSQNQITEAVLSLTKHPRRVEKMGLLAREYVDGLGAKRIIDALLNNKTRG